MAGETVAFLEGLGGRGQEPLLGHTRAIIRFDIADTDGVDPWLVRVQDGTIEVTHAGGEADCVLSADLATFDKVTSGQTNALSATLRGALEISGDPRILVQVQRLFPAPVGMPAIAGDRAVGRRRS